MGKVSGGLACRDFDNLKEYERWAVAHKDLARKLPTVETARGRHVYFEGHFNGIRHVLHGELRGGGGYCLLPPSVHPEGQKYKWIIPINSKNLLTLDPQLAGFIPDVTEHTEQSEQSEAIVIEGVIEKAINETLPFEFGTRNRKIFDFARTLKTLPQFEEADPKQFREVVRAWYNRALPNIRTKEFEETWIDFLQAWPRVKYPKGQEPIMKIFEKVKTIKPPQVAAKLYPDNNKLKILASLCRELQHEAKENPFYLSVRTTGNLLGASPMQASRWLFLLVSDGLLKIVEKGGTKNTVRKATRFKYIAD